MMTTACFPRAAFSAKERLNAANGLIETARAGIRAGQFVGYDRPATRRPTSVETRDCATGRQVSGQLPSQNAGQQRFARAAAPASNGAAARILDDVSHFRSVP